MNREIKFRFWSGTKMLCDIETVMECLKQQLYFEANKTYKLGFDHIGEYNSAFMQFTGLKDKNGVEIYEGDIILTSRGDWGIVKWNAPFFEITVSETQSSLYTREWIESCEIIGNTYENPELL